LRCQGKGCITTWFSLLRRRLSPIRREAKAKKISRGEEGKFLGEMCQKGRMLYTLTGECRSRTHGRRLNRTRCGEPGKGKKKRGAQYTKVSVGEARKGAGSKDAKEKKRNQSILKKGFRMENEKGNLSLPEGYVSLREGKRLRRWEKTSVWGCPS